MGDPNSTYDEDVFGEVRLGETFELRHVMAPFQLIFRRFWIWTSRVFVSGDGFSGAGDCIHIQLHIHIYAYTDIHIRIYVCMNVCMYVCMYMYVCIYVCMYVCIYTYLYCE